MIIIIIIGIKYLCKAMAKSHKKNKRNSCRKKSKLKSVVSERKIKRKLKKLSKIRKFFDSGMLNIFPDKQLKESTDDLSEIQNDGQLNLQSGTDNVEDLIDEATLRVEKFKICNGCETESLILNDKSNYLHFKKLVEGADIILEVLDARDPLGSRCPQVEQLVINTGKILIFVLNKIDLIPKNNLFEWLKYLRQEIPTVAFKSSIESHDYIVHTEDTAFPISETLLSSCCVGASFLTNLLENFCRSLQNEQTLTKVGVVGFPNVGKRSLIKSLKHFHAHPSVETTDITNAVKNLSLHKQYDILDKSGIIYAKDDSPVTLALCSGVKVEDLKDVVSPAKAIVEKVDNVKLCLHYCVPQFSTCHEFLCSLGAKMGNFTVTGTPDYESGARVLINDWNSGKIKYYTSPPKIFIQSKYISIEYSAQVCKIFNISLEKEQIELNKASLMFPLIGISAKSSEPTEGLLEELKINDYALPKVISEFDINKENANEPEGQPNELLPDYYLHKFLKKKYKKFKHKRLKHKRKKFEKLALALSESINASLILE